MTSAALFIRTTLPSELLNFSTLTIKFLQLFFCLYLTLTLGDSLALREIKMKTYTVNQLAQLAGVSVRALHHYDEIGLLKPQKRSESNYRYYGEQELLRLQQILFYKELDFPLARIQELLDDPTFDTLAALKKHREELLHRKEKMQQLIKTIDKTMQHLKTNTMKAEDMYKGFSKAQAEAYEKEAKERWGAEIVEESKARVLKMGKEGLEKVKREGETINQKLAKLLHLSPDQAEVQALIHQHYLFVNQFYAVTPEIYSGLADLYVSDERFKQNYEKYKTGLAEFLREGMKIYCRTL